MSSPDTKICPYCGEEIPAKATKCKYCQENLGSDIETPQEKPVVEQKVAPAEVNQKQILPALSTEELKERLLIIIKDKSKGQTKEDRLRNAAIFYQKHRGGSYRDAKHYVEWLEDKEADQKMDNWFEDYGGCLGRIVLWVIIVAVLFFTNPKSVEKHSSKMMEHFEIHIKEMKIDVNKSLKSNGLEAYYIEKTFNDVVEKKKRQITKEAEVKSFGILSLGRSGNIRTIGALGMVFNISWLFGGDSLNELEIANEVIDKVNADVRTLNTLKQLLY